MDNFIPKAQDHGKHARRRDKLQKGFTAAYPTQSSIPFKFKFPVVQESEKRDLTAKPGDFTKKSGKVGQEQPFGSCVLPSNLARQTHRGTQKILVRWWQEDIPGPGFYNVIHQSPVFNSASFSKRGTCTFPSTCTRLGSIISKYPAANAYTIPSELVSKKDFSNSCSSMFQLPSFMKVIKSETPAPNHYNASISCCRQKNNVSARAGFMSKTQRGSFPVARSGPAPGHYDVNESLVKQSPKFLMSCFKSKTDRGLKLTSTGPGPGYYNPNDYTKIQKKPHIPKASLLNFSAHPLPLPPKPPLPGPGQYEIVDYEGPPKHFISSASFVSNTSRWPVVSSKPSLPGPATYKPEFPGSSPSSTTRTTNGSQLYKNTTGAQGKAWAEPH